MADRPPGAGRLQAIRDALRTRPIGCLFVEPGVKTGLPILYENPHEVGADRIVNSVAAKERYGTPVVVLDFGDVPHELGVVAAEGIVGLQGEV